MTEQIEKTEKEQPQVELPRLNRYTGETYKVSPDKIGLIHLEIIERNEDHILTVKGARDLALALRQAANRVEKHNHQTGRNGKK